jgi:LysM repeat protein
MNTATEAETLKPDEAGAAEEEAVEAEAEPAPDEAESGEGVSSEAESEESNEPEANEGGEEGAEVSAEPVNPADFPTAVPAKTHTVQPGENLTAIARQYGITVQALVAANQISNPDRVDAGTVLTIPAGQ